MICPGVVKWWLNRLLAFVFVAVILFPLLDALLDIEERIESQGMVLCFMVLGVFFGILGFWMRHELTKWRAWSANQRQKSQGELAREAEAHPHQPVYDRSNDDFDAWARQFMDVEALEQLHASHGHEWCAPDEVKKSRWYYDPDLKYEYITLYVLLVVAIVAFSVTNWPASHQDGHENHDRQHEEERMQH
jgi:hypothetical protein